MNRRLHTPLPMAYVMVTLPCFTIMVTCIVLPLIGLFAGLEPIQFFLDVLSASLGSKSGLGYSLFYATNFLFLGLSFAIAFQAGLFNLGADGQVLIASIGFIIVALYFGEASIFFLFPLAILSSLAFGALWGTFAGLIEARRPGSSLLSTYVLNVIAFAVVTFLFERLWQGNEDGQSALQNMFHGLSFTPLRDWEILSDYRFMMPPTVNGMFILALFSLAIYAFMMRYSRFGYRMKVVAADTTAAAYAGIDAKVVFLITMMLAGLVSSGSGLNILLGEPSKFSGLFMQGAGLVGVVVALAARCSVIGLLMMALFFGALTQGLSVILSTSTHFFNVVFFIVPGILLIFFGLFFPVVRPLLTYIHHKIQRIFYSLKNKLKS